MSIQGRVDVVGQFAGGGLGQLLKCRDERGQLFVAKFPKDLSPQSQRLIDDEMRRFQRHQGQNVVKYLGPVERTDGTRGFAMELMDGDLASRIAQHGAMPPKEAINWLLPVVRGLAEIHASSPGAFHGDLKTANILHKGGLTKLADFGLARGGLGQTVVLGPHTWGTPGYMPPEGFSSAQGDVYSLGMVFVAMLLGREPRPEETLRINVPQHPGLEALINRMVALECHQRPDIHEVLRQLESMQSQAANSQSKAVLGTLCVLGGVAAVGLLVSALSRSAK
jgi:serine/threonine protein kinase